MINNVLIENDYLQAIVSPAGAELKGLILKRTNHQLLWQGDPNIWKDSSPWLFPTNGNSSIYMTKTARSYTRCLFEIANEIVDVFKSRAGCRFLQ